MVLLWQRRKLAFVLANSSEEPEHQGGIFLAALIPACNATEQTEDQASSTAIQRGTLGPLKANYCTDIIGS